MEKKKCKNCAHFRQHYALDGRRLYSVYCGHCMHRMVRPKKPDATACEHFAFAPPDTDAFATKEYLSKALVQYVRDLELLPHIEDVAREQLEVSNTNGFFK